MELADNRLVLTEKGIICRGKADQRFVEVCLIAPREAVVGAFQDKTADFVADQLLHNHRLL